MRQDTAPPIHKIEKRMHCLLFTSKGCVVPLHVHAEKLGCAPQRKIAILYGNALLSKINGFLPSTETITIKLSERWIENFKKSFEIRFHCVYGEISADIDVIAHKISRIERVMMKFHAYETWNYDEFNLFYRQLPG